MFHNVNKILFSAAIPDNIETIIMKYPKKTNSRCDFMDIPLA